LERLQKAEDIARAAVFLASTDAKEITGAALNVGGGVVMD
jgi:NAD(P)-dependent dehydrogenase (short-subunit alcohol dehydrogenase family)